MSAFRLFSNKICKLINKYRVITRFKNLQKNIISSDCLDNVLSPMDLIQVVFNKNLKPKTKILL
jgi:hypothetical protein